jgi:iron complex outermembrane receptor protein
MSFRPAWTLLLFPACACAQATEPPVLPPVEVAAPRVPLAGTADVDGYSAGTVSAEGVQTLAGPARTNPFRALDTLPSVNFTATDAYGITVDQNFLRIRGIAGYTYSNLAMNIEGTPSSVSAGQGAVGNLFDLENTDGLRLLVGAMPANTGFGLGNLAGEVNLRLRAPEKSPGAEASVALGSERFDRQFLRVDSGEFGHGSALFVSYANASADKWRGAGAQTREAINAGFSQRLGEDASLKLFAAHTEFSRDEYLALTSTDLRDYKDHYDDDYTESLTGVATTDSSYYRYNTQRFQEDNVMAVLDWQATDRLSIQFRPYWLATNGLRYVGKSNRVNRVDIEQDQYGAVGEAILDLGDHRLTAGHWYQRLRSMPPPLSQKMYNIDSNGDLRFFRWSILADMGDREFNSPYLKLDGSLGTWEYDLGMRYLHETLPGITSYNTTGLGEMGYQAALATNPTVRDELSTEASSFNRVLPSFSARWHFAPAWTARAGFARTVGNPWMGPLYSTFMSNTASFTAAGVRLQDLWDDLKLETSDTLEAGLAWHSERARAQATVFYARIRDKQVNAYDPAVGLSYLQSGAKAKAYGLELSGDWTVVRPLDLFGSLSWNINRFDGDLSTAGGAAVATDGKQITDTPKLMAKLGSRYRVGPANLTGMLRYVGPRYGDALNTEKVGGYATADVYADVDLGRSLGARWHLGLAVQNLFDRKYISSINEGKDDSLPGEVLYYVGAPRSAAITLGASF